MCTLDEDGYREGRWTAPKEAHPTPLELPGEGAVFAFEFDDGIRGSISTAWLEEDEDLAMFVGMAAAHDERRAVDLRVVALLDNLQVDIQSGSDLLEPFIVLPARPGTIQSASIRIRADSISHGAHSLALVMISVATGRVLTGRTFTLFKGDSYDFAPRNDATAEVELTDKTEVLSAPWSDGRSLGIYQPFEGIEQDGDSIPLQLGVQLDDSDDLGACGDMKVPVTVVVLLDSVQISLAGFGPYLRIVLPPDRRANVLTELAGMPLDGEPHTLTILQYQGDGLLSEGPRERLTPWYDAFLNGLGFAYWP